MTKQVPTKPVRPGEPEMYMAKAEEHLDAAKVSLEQRLWTAATTLAVHAAINAVDAITGAELGRRASGESHEQALVLLRGSEKGVAAARHLRPLLKLKPRAEYDHRPVREAEARRAVRHADAAMALAREVVVAS